MLLILKGIIIGIGKIIPGVSGSMLAISMGIYQKLIASVNNFFKYPKDSFNFLFKIAIGVIVSIVFFSNLILDCLNKHYLIIMFFFIGLIIGGFDDINQNTNKKYNYITVISFISVSFLGFISINNEINITNSLGYTTVMWSFAYEDWNEDKQQDEEKANEKILNNLHNGEIMLLHGNSKTNTNILDSIIKKAKNMGYEFKSLDEFAK